MPIFQSSLNQFNCASKTLLWADLFFLLLTYFSLFSPKDPRLVSARQMTQAGHLSGTNFFLRFVVLHSWAKHVTLITEYRQVQANCLGKRMKCRGATCNRQAFHLEGVAILLVALCYRNRDKVQPLTLGITLDSQSTPLDQDPVVLRVDNAIQCKNCY